MAGWTYRLEDTPRGTRRVISLDSALPIAIGGSGLQAVQLVFVDDPVAGYDCLIQLASGDFKRSHARAPRVQWTVDERAAIDVLASQPEAMPPRLSLREPRHRWFELDGASRLSAAFRGADHKRHRVLFDVSNLDRSQLDWDQQRYAQLYREQQEKARAGTQA